MSDDRTLDELRLVLAPEVARAAVFDGWTDAALCQAASDAAASRTATRRPAPPPHGRTQTTARPTSS